MKHTMHLYEPGGELVAKGLKSIEVRLYDEKRQDITVGDEITFIRNDGSELNVIVTGVVICSSFKDLYEHVNVIEIGYTTVTEADYNDMYKYYSKSEEECYGVVGIIFEVKSKE